MKVYIDGILIKCFSNEAHIGDLARAEIFRKYKMKLNLAKCTFAIEAGKLLGFMISKRGIEAYPEKIQALQDMKASTTQKDIQKLKGRFFALNRFMSKSTEQYLPFFKALKKENKFI